MGKISKRYLLDGQNCPKRKSRRYEMQYDIIIKIAEAGTGAGRDNHRRRINLFTGRNPRGIIK